MSSSYDLLPSNEKCDTFKVAFDVYTPRAHFIILHHDKLRVSHDYNKLNNEARLKAIKAAMAMVSHYNLQESAILSLHCGTWITTKDRFHAHVCVDVDDYLRIFDIKKKEIPNWPSRDYVTRQWKESQNPKHYATNVRGYPFRTYFRDEVRAIEDYRRQKKRTTVASSIPPNFTILYHPSEPKVGFAVDDAVDADNGVAVKDAVADDDDSPKSTSAEFRLEAQEALFEFARRNNLTDDMRSRDDNNGCHVCLVLDGKAHG